MKNIQSRILQVQKSLKEHMRAIFLVKKENLMENEKNREKEQRNLMNKLKQDLNEIKKLNANIQILKHNVKDMESRIKADAENLGNVEQIDDELRTESTVKNLERQISSMTNRAR